MGEAINNWPASETPVGVSAQHGRAALRDVAGTARTASAKIRRLNQFKDMCHVHITQISTANISPMKRVNQTRTNVINCLRIHQDLRAFPRLWAFLPPARS